MVSTNVSSSHSPPYMRGNRLNREVYAVITESTCTLVLQSNWEKYWWLVERAS